MHDDLSYTPHQVERLLRNYFQIKSVLHGSSRPPADRAAPVNDRPQEDQRPHPIKDFVPFSEPRHARGHIDGKARARAATELHVSVMDLEIGLTRLSDHDLELVYKYFLFGTHTLDELCIDRGVTSRASMSKLLQRVLRRLTKAMNNDPDDT